jgi:NADPH-dependent FMN reductase
MTSGRCRILGIPGSLRHGSYNRALLRAARQVAPDGVEIGAFDLLPIPPYNADGETRERIRAFVEAPVTWTPRLRVDWGRAMGRRRCFAVLDEEA